MSDLKLTELTIYWHGNKQAFDFAALFHNAGGEPASGPFNIILGVTYVSGYDGILGSDDVDAVFTTSQVTVTEPAGFTLDPGVTYRSAYSLDIPFVAIPGENYNYATFTVYLEGDGRVLDTLDKPPAPPAPLPPSGYSPPPGQYWWKLQPHSSGMRPPNGPVIGHPTKAYP